MLMNQYTHTAIGDIINNSICLLLYIKYYSELILLTLYNLIMLWKQILDHFVAIEKFS